MYGNFIYKLGGIYLIPEKKDFYHEARKEGEENINNVCLEYYTLLENSPDRPHRSDRLSAVSQSSLAEG